MIDIKSRQIMFELFKDGRATNASIAKKLGMSVLTVAKKVNAMTRNGVITIKAIPNPVKMGNHASAFIGLNVDIKKIDDICAKLKKIPNINLMVTCFGRFDLLMIVYFNSLESLEFFTKNDLPNVDGIRNVNTFIITDIVSSVGTGDKLKLDNLLAGDNSPVLDDMDRAIISALMENGRPNYSNLAKELDTSTSTISRRISSLMDEGFIKIAAIPNHRLDYLATAFIVINAEYPKINHICDKLAGCPGVQLIMRVMNDYDILFGLNSPNREELYKFMKEEVACIDGILKTETFILADFLHLNVSGLIHTPVTKNSKRKKT